MNKHDLDKRSRHCSNGAPTRTRSPNVCATQDEYTHALLLHWPPGALTTRPPPAKLAMRGPPLRTIPKHRQAWQTWYDNQHMIDVGAGTGRAGTENVDDRGCEVDFLLLLSEPSTGSDVHFQAFCGAPEGVSVIGLAHGRGRHFLARLPFELR